MRKMEGQEFGATGTFPEGKLNASDEGELQVGVAADSKNCVVILAFGKPVAWLGLPPAQARGLADLLVKHAASLEQAT